MATRRLLQFVGAFLPALLFALHVSGAMTAQAAQSSVTIQGFAFSPTPLTVQVGDTVTWTNMDSAPHNATANNGGFKTPDLQQGQSASVTVTTPGTYTYICTIHPNMKATLIVQAATTGTTPGLPSTGGGGMATHSIGLPTMALSIVGLSLLLALGVIVARRRFAR
jgi:plastocyanin